MNASVILSFRDPVARAFSNLAHAKAHNRVPRNATLEDLVITEGGDINTTINFINIGLETPL